jgi:hypothetical protein
MNMVHTRIKRLRKRPKLPLLRVLYRGVPIKPSLAALLESGKIKETPKLMQALQEGRSLTIWGYPGEDPFIRDVNTGERLT